MRQECKSLSKQGWLAGLSVTVFLFPRNLSRSKVVSALYVRLYTCAFLAGFSHCGENVPLSMDTSSDTSICISSVMEQASVEFADIQGSTDLAKLHVTKYLSENIRAELKRAVDKCQHEFEQGKDAGFEEARKMGLIHANMQRETGQVQEFSQLRLKLAYAKLFLNNLNMDRFQDIASVEFAVGVKPEQFVRFMETCASSALQSHNALVKTFRCYGRLNPLPRADSREQGAQATSPRASLVHPTPDGIMVAVDNWLNLLQDANLLRSDRDSRFVCDDVHRGSG